MQHEEEILLLARAAEEGYPVRTFLTSPAAIELCQDKMASYVRLRQDGLPLPEGLLLHPPNDLKRAFKDLGSRLWVRAIHGAGGKGSMPVSDFDTARRWIDFHEGWGSFMAAERMTSKCVAWECPWADGELISAQGRERLYWGFPTSPTPA